jgi:preprotein translocase subunit Sec61beta
MPPLRRTQNEGLAGGAGLIRYFDVDEGGPKVDPKMLLGFVVVVILFEILSKVILS